LGAHQTEGPSGEDGVFTNGFEAWSKFLPIQLPQDKVSVPVPLSSEAL
jgi:hypothetical protein